MKICENNHVQICFNGQLCPLCSILSDRTVLEDRLFELKAEDKELKIKIEKLTTKEEVGQRG